MNPRVALALIVALVAAVLLGSLFQRPSSHPERHFPGDGHDHGPSAAPAKPELTDVVVGKGDEAAIGRWAVIEYKAYLSNGRIFDGSHLREKPSRYLLGADPMPKGLEMGIVGMREGGRRRMRIPPELGFGAGGSADGSVPPNETLTYDVTLKQVQ